MDESLEYKIKVMQHFADGGEVELVSRKLVDEDYELCSKPSWNWRDFTYRIKKQPPKPKYAPFTFEDREMFRNKWIRAKYQDSPEVVITTITLLGFKYGNLDMVLTYQEAFEKLEFLDGTPFGKQIN